MILVKSYFLFFSIVVVSLLIIYYFYTIYYNMNSKPVYAIAVFTDAIKGTVAFTEEIGRAHV